MKRPTDFNRNKRSGGCGVWGGAYFEAPTPWQIALIMTFLLLHAVSASAQTAVTNVQELQDIALDTGASYYLANDINAEETADWNGGAGFVPIADFSGTLDGKGHTITGLTIHRPGENKVGLFAGIINGGHVKDLRMYGADITGNSQVGPLSGYLFLADVSGVSVHNSLVNGSTRVGIDKLGTDETVHFTHRITLKGGN